MQNLTAVCPVAALLLNDRRHEGARGLGQSGNAPGLYGAPKGAKGRLGAAQKWSAYGSAQSRRVRAWRGIALGRGGAALVPSALFCEARARRCSRRGAALPRSSHQRSSASRKFRSDDDNDDEDDDDDRLQCSSASRELENDTRVKVGGTGSSIRDARISEMLALARSSAAPVPSGRCCVPRTRRCSR